MGGWRKRWTHSRPRHPHHPQKPTQTFAESLFARLKPGGRSSADGASATAPSRPFTRSDARTAALRVVSRVVGTHRLLLLNFYPHVQRALAPHARDVTLLIAALVQATHELVPPDALAPVLRQLVDGFVHDRARPEVAVLGLNAVRELCARAPAIMDADLLSDLALYRKARDKEVAAAARGIVGLFREVAPALLAKKDRGRGADMTAAPLEYGAAPVADRVPGAELLEAAVAAGKGSDDDEEEDDGSEWESLSGGEEEDGCGGAASGSEEEEEEEDVSGSEDEADDATTSSSSNDEDEDAPARPSAPPPPKKQRAAEPGSLSSLRRAVAAATAAASPAAPPTPPTATPIEQGRILDDADFARIRALQHKARVAAAMAKHGLARSTAGGSKRARLEMAAEDEAEEAEAAAAARAAATERALDPSSLEARRRGRQDKEARLARVMEGREGRAFGAAAARHKRKTGGLSNKQLQKRKAMPLAAAAHAAKRRAASQGNRARGRKGPKR
jgi:protein SDA1